VNGHEEGREDHARLPERHGSGAHELQHGRSVEALQHDSEAQSEKSARDASASTASQARGSIFVVG